MIWSTRLCLMAIIVSSLWLQLIESFCIYNYLDDPNAYIDINDANYSDKSFKKVVHPGTSECCPYTNPDCSNSGRSQNISKYFNVRIKFDGQDWDDVKWKYTKCESGGGLAIYGTATNYYGKCTYSNGNVYDEPIFELPPKKY